MAEAALDGGTGEIRGSALIRQRGGTVVTCAGNEVFLIPHTPSAQRELRRVFGGDRGFMPRGGSPMFGGGQVVVPPPNHRSTTCDAQGFFSFDEVNAGDWFIMTSIVWEVADNYQGGALLGQASLEPGEAREIVLTN